MKIFKYELQLADDQQVELPHGAEILSVQFQKDQQGHEILQLWALVDEYEKIMVPRLIRMYGTGHYMAGHPGKFLGTVQEAGGALIWHIFDTSN